MQEGLCGDEEGSSAHSQQGDELQKPEPVGQHHGQEGLVHGQNHTPSFWFKIR